MHQSSVIFGVCIKGCLFWGIKLLIDLSAAIISSSNSSIHYVTF